VRENLDESLLRIDPMFQDPCSARTAGQIAMAFKQPSHLGYIFLARERLQIDAGLVATAR
jgi:hypothetical protein